MTGHHPQAKLLVERFHRQLKASLTAANVPHWTGALSLVLLGIHNAVKSDAEHATAKLVHTTILQLPGEFVDISSPSMSTCLLSRKRKLTNMMCLVTTVFTRPWPTDIFV